MPPDTAHPDWRQGGFADRLPAAWRMPLARLGLAWLAVCVLTARDWATMADKWWNVSTYNHILFVPLIVGWYVWVRRHELAKLEPQAWWPGLAMLGGALLLWLLGSLAGVNTASQLGAVVALQACVVTLLGPRIVAALVFPMAYGLFLVPFGDELVPALQMITAKLSIELTLLSGVPAVVDGVFIDTPAGLFEVAEACSGVKFLIAMLALAALVTHSCFKSWKRRLILLAAAIALPILANGVRAWGTIYIAQSQGIEFAEGFDHIFYGWVFFGLVIVALLGASWRWFDRDPEESHVTADAILRSPLLERLSSMWMRGNRGLLAAIAVVALFGAWSTAAGRVTADLPQQLAFPTVSGWEPVEQEMAVEWRPRASGASHDLLQTYRDASGLTVDVFLAIYDSQHGTTDATASLEGAVPPDSAWRWLSGGEDTAEARVDYLLANGSVKRLAQTSYRTGSLTTSQAVPLKLTLMRDKVLLQPQPTMLLIVSAAEGTDAELALRVDDFIAAMGDRGEWMDHAAGLR